MRLPITLFIALATAGCAVSGLPHAAAVTSAANAPVEPLAGLAFTSITPENARYAGGAGVAIPATASTSTTGTTAAGERAPAPAGGPVAPVTPAGLTSGNIYGGSIGIGSAFGGGEPTSLVSVTQTETTGSKGPYLQVSKTLVQPVITAWAADARLMSINGSTGPDGLLLPASPGPSLAPGCQTNGADTSWTLTYFSTSRDEMLQFVVTAAKTLIIRTRWVPLDLGSVAVTVDDDAAIQALTTAIQTQGFQSVEEKTGLDYFLGMPYNQDCGGAPMVLEPSVAGNPTNQILPVYAVPADTRWSVTLELMLGKPVWELNFYSQSNNAPSAQDAFYYNNSANGLVDARTGDVIRFTRPNKQPVNTQLGPSPSPFLPLPYPETPAPTILPLPSVVTSPAVTPAIAASSAATTYQTY